MSLDDVLNELAVVDYELQELEKQRTLAQSAAAASEVRRLEGEIDDLVRRKMDLWARWRHQHSR
jgi:hypothetical protein